MPEYENHTNTSRQSSTGATDGSSRMQIRNILNYSPSPQGPTRAWQAAPSSPSSSGVQDYRCTDCRKDRQKCEKDPNSGNSSCVRCVEMHYRCSHSISSTASDLRTAPSSSRRNLSRLKCDYCRVYKIKCLPVDRQKGTRCENCIEKGHRCQDPKPSCRRRNLNTSEMASSLQWEVEREGERRAPEERWQIQGWTSS